MGYDGVPLGVEAGASNQVDLVRVQNFYATGGHEGVLGPNDLKAQALSTPGTSINVLTGAFSAINRATNKPNQSYIGRVTSADVVGITANGPTATRYDLVVALIKNPYIAGEPWTAPASVANGPYVETAIIEGVPAATTTVRTLTGTTYTYRTTSLTSSTTVPTAPSTWSAITLARLAVPINTATITNAMFTDLRTVNSPVTGPQPPPTGGGDGGAGSGQGAGSGRSGIIARVMSLVESITSATFAAWPTEATFTRDIPYWATHADFVVHIANPLAITSSVTGEVQFVATLSGTPTVLATRPFQLTWPGANSRGTIVVPGQQVAIPASLRGQTVTFSLNARRTAGTGTLQSDANTVVAFNLAQFVAIAS